MSKYLPINLFIRQALLYPLTSPFLPPVDKVEKNYSYAAGKLVGTLSAGGALPRTSQLTIHRTGDDGTYQKGYTLERPQVEATRFTDNLDGTVTDNGTGLMWIKDPKTNPGAPFNNVQQWPSAIDVCLALTFAGHSDWRLPNILELVSITKWSTLGPCAYTAFFTTATGTTYWSSTTNAQSATWCWGIEQTYGQIIYVIKTAYHWSRPVRLGLPT